jgi:putative ABC transport system ATP-binding protein
MSDDTVVCVRELTYSHGSGERERQVLSEVSVAPQSGAITVLTGPSGSGKSTLLTIIGGLRSASRGNVRVLDVELIGASERERVKVRRRIGFVFQKHNLAPALTVRQNIQMGLQLGGRLKAREARARIEEVAGRIGLVDHLDKHPAQLSGGQQQRAGIARALVNRPRLILADEPTASLDRNAGEAVMALMHELATQEGATIILVTHDKRVLDQAHALVTLEDGRLVQPGDGLLGETSAAIKTLRRLGSGDLGHLLAFGSALARVACADGRLHAEEVATIRDRLSTSASLSSAELEFVMELVLAMGESWTRQHASHAQRSALGDALRAVAVADRDHSLTEQNVIDSLMLGPGGRQD